jgi:hypothetical protein
MEDEAFLCRSLTVFCQLLIIQIHHFLTQQNDIAIPVSFLITDF